MLTLPDATLGDEAPRPVRVQLEDTMARAMRAMDQGHSWLVAYFLRVALRLDLPRLAEEELEFLLGEFDTQSSAELAARQPAVQRRGN